MKYFVDENFSTQLKTAFSNMIEVKGVGGSRLYVLKNHSTLFKFRYGLYRAGEKTETASIRVKKFSLARKITLTTEDGAVCRISGKRGKQEYAFSNGWKAIGRVAGATSFRIYEGKQVLAAVFRKKNILVIDAEDDREDVLAAALALSAAERWE